MRIRAAIVMCSVWAAPLVARAQVVIEAPVYAPPPAPVYAPPPAPIYAPPPAPVYAPPVYAPPPPVYVAPRVIVRTRVRWWRRPRVVVVAQAPAPVYVAPAPAPVYVAPAPVYVEPAPVYAPPPAAPIVVAQAPAAPPPWTARFGLGVRGTGQVVNDSWNNLGIGGEFLVRASAHVSTELACEYQKNASGPIDRTDIPTTLGVRLHIGRPSWVVSPYFVLAAGLDYAWQDLKFTQDQAYYFDGQVGGGLELRLGQHVAITADARFDGKKRVDTPATAVVNTRSVDGKPVSPLGDEYGGQFRLGVAVYF